MARPIPDEEPVIIATLSRRRPGDGLVELVMVRSKLDAWVVIFEVEKLFNPRMRYEMVDHHLNKVLHAEEQDTSEDVSRYPMMCNLTPPFDPAGSANE